MKVLIIADDDEVSSLINPCDVDLLISLGDLSDTTILKIAKTVKASKMVPRYFQWKGGGLTGGG